MKKALALRDFGIAYDGIRVTPVAKGDTVDVPDDAADGLEKEGYITFDIPAQAQVEVEAEEPPLASPEVAATDAEEVASPAVPSRRRR